MTQTNGTQRRFSRRPYRSLVFVLALCVVLAVRYWRGEERPQPAGQPLAPGLHRVVRVVDGDTIIVEPHVVVRLIGVDAPESVKPDHPVEPWGPEASDFTRHFLSVGAVHLTFDNRRTDRFGRVLAYVWVGDHLLNEELIRAGLAQYEPEFPYAEAMKRRFRRAQEEAQRAGIGIWEEPEEEEARRPRGPAPSEPLAWAAIGYTGRGALVGVPFARLCLILPEEPPCPPFAPFPKVSTR